MQAVESCSNEKDGSVDIFTSRKFDAVFVFVSLAKKKGASEKDGKEKKSGETVFVVLHDVRMCNRNRYPRSEKKNGVNERQPSHIQDLCSVRRSDSSYRNRRDKTEMKKRSEKRKEEHHFGDNK